MGNRKGYRAPALAGDERAAVARRYAARYQGGATIRALADESGRSYGAIHALVREGGAVLRRRGAPEGPRPGRSAARRTTEGVEDAYGSPDPEFDVDAELARYDFSFLEGTS